LKKYITYALLAAFLFSPVSLLAQPGVDHTREVDAAKQQLVDAGVSLVGACGAMKITNLVAWNLRPHYGLLSKAGGFRAVLHADGSCESGGAQFDTTREPGFATDYLIERATGHGYDTLSDGGGANGAHWQGPETDQVMVNRNFQNFSEPLDPAGYFPQRPPAVVTQPPPVAVPLPTLPSMDFTSLITLINSNQTSLMLKMLELDNEIAQVKADLDEHRAAVKSKWDAVVGSAYFKYALAIAGGWLAHLATNGTTATAAK
jgi:hypothetical protein